VIQVLLGQSDSRFSCSERERLAWDNGAMST
jgi:hypothetical protein